MNFVKTLSRNEMKNIMGGLCCQCYEDCNSAASSCLNDCAEIDGRGPNSGYAECVNDCEEEGDACIEQCPTIN